MNIPTGFEKNDNKKCDLYHIFYRSKILNGMQLTKEQIETALNTKYRPHLHPVCNEIDTEHVTAKEPT